MDKNDKQMILNFAAMIGIENRYIASDYVHNNRPDLPRISDGREYKQLEEFLNRITGE